MAGSDIGVAEAEMGFCRDTWAPNEAAFPPSPTWQSKPEMLLRGLLRCPEKRRAPSANGKSVHGAPQRADCSCCEWGFARWTQSGSSRRASRKRLQRPC